MSTLRTRVAVLEKRDMPPEALAVQVFIVCADSGLMANGEPPSPPEPGDLCIRITPHAHGPA